MTKEDRIQIGGIIAYLSVALALGVQAGTAVWWAGTMNTRMGMIERQIDQYSLNFPAQAREVTEALREIAVLKERIIRVDENTARTAAAIERIEAGNRP